jgi:hypothetical protein
MCDVGPFINLTIGKGTINDEGSSHVEEEEAALARLYKWFLYGGDDNK